MAVKTMTVSAIDKQFIDDNMLTDEDFHFDEEADFEERSLLESLSNELQMANGDKGNHIDSLSVEEIHSLDLNSSLDDLFKDFVYDIELKEEPLSPYSSEVSTEGISSNNVSVITIPEVNSCEQIGMITDTPPHTPPSIVDTIPSSPSSFTGPDPIVVSVHSASGTSYTIPHTPESVISPIKFAVNIQPKRDFTDVKSTVKLGHKDANSEQIVKLANGTVRLKSPVNVGIPVSSVLQASKKSNTLPSKLSVKNLGRGGTSQNNLVEVCAAALKRQERIIRNRESAYLSRKRKKEYVQKLEAELNQITAENSSLREENCRLKLKISDLENEVSKLKSTFSPKKIKNTACLMVVVFMLTFNFSLYSPIFNRTNFKPQRTDLMDHRVGRVLLWDAGYDSQKRNSTKAFFSKRKYINDELESPYIVDVDKAYNSSCQHFINKTESLRLENDLLGWVERVEKKQKLKASRKLGIVDMKIPLPHLPKLQSVSRRKGEHKKDIWAKRKNRNEILIYQTPRKAYEDFFDAIHRRDDTFYFVSFSGDHLLLPAIAHNQTLRPRMSFVMPAMTLNDSVDDTDEHVSMMQIDCEVMDTKLVYIKESVIPPHLRQKQNSTSKSDTRHSAKYAVNQNSRSLQSSRRKVHLQPSGNG